MLPWKQSKKDEAKILYSTPTVKIIDLVGENLRYPLFKVTSISCNYSILGANHGEEHNNNMMQMEQIRRAVLPSL
jgi:hypothetical protein